MAFASVEEGGVASGFHSSSRRHQRDWHGGIPGVLREFGFRVVVHWKDPGGELEIAHLKLSENYLEIFWYRDQVPAPETAGSLVTDLPRIGVKHFALVVDSVYEAKNFVENHGISSTVEVQCGRTGVTYFFIKDP